VEAGISQELFWAYTPRELDLALRGVVAERERQEAAAIISGWVAAYCARSKKLPQLKSLLDKAKRKQKGQTVEEQLRTIRMITAMYSAKKEG
jgi:hypothetical protein